MISKKISDTLPNNNEQENKLRTIALSKNLIYKKMTPSENTYLYSEYRHYIALPRRGLRLCE